MVAGGSGWRGTSYSGRMVSMQHGCHCCYTWQSDVPQCIDAFTHRQSRTPPLVSQSTDAFKHRKAGNYKTLTFSCQHTDFNSTSEMFIWDWELKLSTPVLTASASLQGHKQQTTRSSISCQSKVQNSQATAWTWKSSSILGYTYQPDRTVQYDNIRCITVSWITWIRLRISDASKQWRVSEICQLPYPNYELSDCGFFSSSLFPVLFDACMCVWSFCPVVYRIFTLVT